VKAIFHSGVCLHLGQHRSLVYFTSLVLTDWFLLNARVLKERKLAYMHWELEKQVFLLPWKLFQTHKYLCSRNFHFSRLFGEKSAV